MNKKYTKVLSLLLAFVMVFAAVAPVAMAAETDIEETPSVKYEELGKMTKEEKACYGFEFLFVDSKGNAMQKVRPGVDLNKYFKITMTGDIDDALTTAEFVELGQGKFFVAPKVVDGVVYPLAKNSTYTIFPVGDWKSAIESIDGRDEYDLEGAKLVVKTDDKGCVAEGQELVLAIGAPVACWTVRTVEVNEDVTFLGAAFQKFEVVTLEQDGDGYYVLDENKDYIADEVVRTYTTNRDGWFIGTHAQLLGILEDGDIAPGELFGVRLADGGKVYAVNVWDIDDIDRYDDTLKKVLVDPKVHFALKDCGKVSATIFINKINTFDIPVYAYVDRFDNTTIKPVEGAVFGLYKVTNTDTTGKITTEDQPIQTVTTDAQGYGTFVSVAANEFFDTLETLALGTPNGIRVPYVVKQISAPTGYYTSGVYYYVSVGKTISGDIALQVRDNSGKVATIDFRLTANAENRLNFPHFVGNANNRVAGIDRYATSVEVAKAAYPAGLVKTDGKVNVVIANGQNFPDALGGQPTTAAYNAPMLLTPANKLPQVVVDYLKAEGVNNAIILGGTASVNASIENELAAMGITSTRIAGSTRYGTAVAAGNQLIKLLNDDNKTNFLHGFNENGRIFLANGEGFADILTVSAPARQFGNPILLTQKDSLAAETAQALKDWKVKEVVIIGGNNSVSQNVANEISALGLGITVNRLEGANRQETAMKVADTYYPQANHVFIASDSIFADALVGSLLAAKNQSPILLVGRDTVDAKVAQYIKDENITEFTIIGGPNTVSEKVAIELDRIVLANK